MAKDTSTDKDRFDPADCELEDYLADQLRQLDENIAKMEAAGSWQALTNATRLALKIREDLDALRSSQDAEVDLDSIEDIIGFVLELPDSVFADLRVQKKVRECA